MQCEELLSTKLILDEMDKIILVIDKNNHVIIANELAARQLGIKSQDGPMALEAVFHENRLYDVIAAQAYHYHWTGVLPVYQCDNTAYLTVRAKFITGDKCVFNQLLLTGHLSADHSNRESVDYPPINQEQFRKLNEISSTINSNLDFQSICEEITMKAAELVGADQSLLYSIEDYQVGVFATWNMTPAERNMFRLVDMEHGVIKNCLRNMSPVLVPYYSKHPDWIPEIYEELNCFESFILFPLLAQKQLVGVLALIGHEPCRFDDKHLMLLQMTSNQMAIAVLNAQVYSEIRTLNKHLEEEVCLKVNELRVSELQLMRKSNELEAVFNSITDILVVVDKHLRILDVNQAALNAYAIEDKRNILNKKYCDVTCEGQNCAACPIQETFDHSRLTFIEMDLSSRIYSVTYFPVSDENGTVLKVLCSLRDVTLVKRKSGELIQSQKMQAIGQLAAGIAHEIRNPLGAISNYVYILESWLDELHERCCPVDDEIRDAFRSIKRLVERSENVIRNLLDFSREKPSEITVFTFYDVIEQLLVLVGKTAQRRKVEIRVEGNSKLKIRSDSSALQHILFNLVINAIDALPSGGQVMIWYSRDQENFLIQVQDNGVGIKKDAIDKIFNPFYTTKAPDRGTGLGLYLVYNLVKQLNGQILVDSKPGIGTMFSVTLPQSVSEESMR